MDQRTRVLYQALADFSALTREVRQAKREIAQLKAAEAAYNTDSTRANRARTQALQARSRASTQEGQALRTNIGLIGRYTTAQTALTTATRLGTKAIQAENRALATNAQRLVAAAAAARAYAASQRNISRNTDSATDAIRGSSTYQRRGVQNVRFRPSADTTPAVAKGTASAAKDATEATNRWGRAVMWLRGQLKTLNPAMTQATAGATRLQRAFVRLGNWRPRLVPPFIALIPVIASVVAAINPLVSLLGAVGTAAFGLMSNIASLSGAFLALPGILAAVAGGIASVIASMGGVGNVFKTYSAMQKAAGKSAGGGGGGAGETQAERADRLARAEFNLSKAQRQVTKAQQNLNKAREQALKDLIDLRLEVSRASIDEERAIANLQQARDNYNNVMADPSSQRGDKLDARVAIKEAEADLADVRRKNIQNQKDLAAAERAGVEGSERVLDAKEDLQDAIYAERDAQKSLKDEQKGGTAAASALATATNEYEEALAKLSPSARTVVLALIGMQDQWNAMRRDLQENFFSRFVNDMDKLPRIIQTIGNFLRPAAQSMGEFTSALINLLASPEWTRDLATIGQQNGRIIDHMGEGFLSLITFFKDLTIAAAPFTDWLTGAFAEGLDNLSQLLDIDPEKQGLARWLETVRGRLERWWQIVKNIGTTIFNYGAAASEFGDWLSQGFLEMTERWKTASEKARQDGSPFRKFLEDIQPLLSNVNGLLGDFFGWMRQEIMDPANIDDANDLVSILRNDLGPALAGLLDALAETDIDEKIIEAISAIIRSITEIIEAGGGEAFEAFADVVTGFFEFLADFLSGLNPGQLDLIMKFLGTLAALSFIGKFTGLTNLVGSLLSLAGGSGALATIFGGFAKLDKLKFLSLIGKGGLLVLLAGLALGSINSAGKGQEWRDLLSDPNKPGNAGKMEDVVKNDGSQLAAGGPFGIINELLYGIDDILGTAMGDAFDNFMDEATANLYTWLKEDFTQWVADTVYNWKSFWGSLAAWWDNTFVQPVANAWGWLTTTVNAGWNWLNAYVITPFRNAWNAAGIWFNQTFVQPVTKAWNTLRSSLQFGWNWVNAYVITPFKVGFNTLLSTIGSVVNGMSNKWNQLKRNFAAPVNFVIDTVYNNGIRSFWNGINNALNLRLSLPYINPVRFAEGGVMPAPGKAGARGRYAQGGVLPGYTPGRDVHEFVSPTGGRLSLSGGEAIMRPEFTKMVGGKRGVDALNEKAKRGQAFANGGVFNGGKAQHFAGGGVWEVAGDVWDKFRGFFTNPAQFVAGGIGNLVNSALSSMGTSPYGRLIAGMPQATIRNLADIAKSKASVAKRKTESIDADPRGMKWGAMWGVVKRAFPNATLNSAYRPGSRTVNGGMSYHSAGRAIDVTPSMAIFNWLKQNFPNSRELIYSPAGARQLQNGREHFWGGAVRAQHWDHVHWAMKNGGVLPKLYDRGGWLPHGGAAVNKSGRPEAVLTNEESRGLKSLLNGVGLSRPDGGLRLADSVGSLRGAAQQVVDYSTNIQKVEINNPVPEPVSVSLPKAIRQIGYAKNARQNA